ncbi:MAG: HAD-IC family P-type ATPase, partial [Coriobacteriia bacterium]|nr:HAD-IC family P-type ATPase [Coriobacteriia bacterium]
IDPSASILTVTIDTALLSPADLVSEVERLGHEVANAVGHAAYRITGLDCPDCARTVDVSVGYLEGVLSASLNFASSTLLVEYDPSADPRPGVVALVRRMDYGIESLGTDARAVRGPTWWELRRGDVAATASGIFIAIGWLLGRMGDPWQTVSVVAFALAIASGGALVFRRALMSLAVRSLDMNVLMSVAVIGAAALGDWLEGATVVFLFAVGGLLESRSLARTRRSIRDLMDLSPQMARVVRDGREFDLAPSEVVLGDRVRVRPGERIPLDGSVVGGSSAVDESPITGESVPVEKGMGAPVYTGTLNMGGLLEVEVTARASDSTLSRIICLVEDAQARQAPFQRLVDRFTRYYTPAVVGFAAAIAVVPPVLGELLGQSWGSPQEWVYRGLVLLVVGCPCALVISTPVAVVSAITRATRDGVLVKGGAFLEMAPRIAAVAFDKTGTLT